MEDTWGTNPVSNNEESFLKVFILVVACELLSCNIWGVSLTRNQAQASCWDAGVLATGPLGKYHRSSSSLRFVFRSVTVALLKFWTNFKLLFRRCHHNTFMLSIKTMGMKSNDFSILYRESMNEDLFEEQKWFFHMALSNSRLYVCCL